MLDTSDTKSEKPIIPVKTLDCCARVICSRCISGNPRYKTYCPYCQVSTTPSVLPQRLRDPPPYDSLHHTSQPPREPASEHDDAPPLYRATPELASKEAFQDVLHFVAPNDSLRSLSLAYDVPMTALRNTNNVYSDHLLQGRKTLLIPGDFYKGGVSLSPRPIENEDEEIRKTKVRRFMVATKVAEYDVALLYLGQADYDLDGAIAAFLDDDKWERDHPVAGGHMTGKTSVKSVGMRRFVGLGG